MTGVQTCALPIWRELLVNDGHKLLFELRGQVALPTACGTVGKMRATNFEQLFLMAGEQAPARQYMRWEDRESTSNWKPE